MKGGTEMDKKLIDLIMIEIGLEHIDSEEETDHQETELVASAK